MTVRNLEFLFRPESVAVVAEPDKPSRYAEVVLANLAVGGFSGPVISVSVRKRSLFSIGADVRIGELAVVPDLAIICAALDKVPSIISQLGARGTRAVIVGPWLWHRMNRGQVLAARKAILEAARPYLMRVLGPGSGGLVVPASRSQCQRRSRRDYPGEDRLGQSVDRRHRRGARSRQQQGNRVLDGAAPGGQHRYRPRRRPRLAYRRPGHAIDPGTVRFAPVRAEVHVGGACRRAQQTGRLDTQRAGETSGTLSGPFTADEVYDAALRRAGWVRIDTLGDLFEAAEAMARVRPMRGERLTILANGHGLGRIAGDTLLRSGGQLGTLSKDTAKHLGQLLPTRSTLGNPLALPADVTPANWAAALAAVLADDDTDAVLTVCSPSPFAPSTEVAEAICTVSQQSERNVFTCWVGGSAMLEAQRIAAAKGVLSHDSPEKAIAVFLGVLNYRRNRDLLMQLPPSLAEDFLAGHRCCPWRDQRSD